MSYSGQRMRVPVAMTCGFILEKSKENPLPCEEDAFVQAVTAWIDKTTYLAPRIEQVDIIDNKTVYLLKNAQCNAPLADGLFSFKIPDDAEVVDMR